MVKKQYKKLSLFLILLLFAMSVLTPQAKGIENPYGEKRWRWEWGYMEIVHDNGTEGIVKREGEQYDYFQMEIVSEEKGWAEIRVTWKESDYQGPKNYWNDHDIPDVDNLTFMVKKSNNVAYFKKTDEVYGFNPFYIYNYTDYGVLDGEKRVQLDLHRKIEFQKCIWNNREGYLSVLSKRYSINYTKFPNTNYSKTHEIYYLDVTSKGPFVANFNAFIPAEYLIDNVTTEEYIRIAGSSSTEALDYLDHTINMSVDSSTNQTNGGENPSSVSPSHSKVLIAGIAILVMFSSIAGYLGYRKQRER